MTTTIKHTNELNVELVNVSASDRAVANAAWVSTLGERVGDADPDRLEGLINFLMRNDHTSPFEHGMFQFFVHVPLFVRAEIRTHRTFSFNEESGRYRQLQPLFYRPNRVRPLQQAGKVGEYRFEPGTIDQHELLEDVIHETDFIAYNNYERALNAGICKEMARQVLPMNIYTSLYITADPHNLMHFLDLRTEGQAMYEMRVVAGKMENEFAKHMPITYLAWKKKVEAKDRLMAEMNREAKK